MDNSFATRAWEYAKTEVEDILPFWDQGCFYRDPVIADATRDHPGHVDDVEIVRRGAIEFVENMPWVINSLTRLGRLDSRGLETIESAVGKARRYLV